MLTLFSTGEDSNGACGYGLTDQPWGKRARKAVQSTKRLKDANCVQIQEEASVYMQSPESDDKCEEDDTEAKTGADSMSMHANIDID